MADDEHQRRARERIGSTINGKYRLDALIGVGGMAAVYRTTHRNQARLALKMLHPELSHRLDVRSRFLREAYTANSVGHPGVVLVTDDDVAEDGSAFLVMELLDGMNGEELLARHGRLPVEAVLEIARQLLDVLAAAHAASIVHRDIKPANLFLTRDGTVKVLDFGIARVLDADSAAATSATGAGMPIGTPAYMAPEQALGRSVEIGPHSDVWAAGATLFALLSGETVHAARAPAEMLVHAATRPARPLREAAPHAPEAIAALVDRALSFDAGARFADAGKMAAALSSVVEAAGGPPPSRSSLAALMPPRASLLPPPSGSSLQVAAELASAPTLHASASPVALPSGETLPVAGTKHPAEPGRRRRAPVIPLAVGVVLALALGGLWLRARVHASAGGAGAVPGADAASAAAPTSPEPTLVLVVGSQNFTTDPALEGTLDIVLESALLRSPFLYPYAGKAMRRLVSEVAPGAAAKDDELGRLVAAKKKLPVALVRITVASAGGNLAVSLTATGGPRQAPLADLRAEAAGKEAIVATVADLACSLRAALGDAPCDPGARGRTGLSANVEADHEYLVGNVSFGGGRYDAAVEHMQKAIALDPGFVMAHNALGLLLLNLSRQEEGRAMLRFALAHREELSDREWLKVSGTAHAVTDEFDQAAQAYTELLARWPHDSSLRANLAAAYSQEGDFERALAVGRQAAEENPEQLHAWSNIPAFLLMKGDIEGAAAETRRVLEKFPRPLADTYTNGALASALLGRRADVDALFRKAEDLDPSRATAAEADFAAFEGRLLDSAGLLKTGLAADEKNGATSNAQVKWVMLAEVKERMGDAAGARQAAEHAAKSDEIALLARAARVLAKTGRVDDAATLGRIISAHPGTRAPLLAGIVAADVLAARGGTKEAIGAAIGEVGTGPGSWVAHADLGAAYLGLRAFEDAERELEKAVGASGQGSTAFYDLPTLAFLPPVRFRLAQAKEALHRAEAKQAYEAFLALEPGAQKDPLVIAAKKRAAAL